MPPYTSAYTLTVIVKISSVKSPWLSVLRTRIEYVGFTAWSALRHPQFVADDGEGRVVRIAIARHEAVGVGIPGIRIRARQRADHGAPGELFATVALLKATAVGASFTFVTVMAKTWSADRPPWSVPRTRML